MGMPILATDADHIAEARTVEGGHLFIGLNGYVLHFARGSILCGYDVAAMKAGCVAAGLPVVDSRPLLFDASWDLAVNGPMVAVGEPPSPLPHGRLSFAPFAAVAEAYRAAGAEVLNLTVAGMAEAGP